MERYLSVQHYLSTSRIEQISRRNPPYLLEEYNHNQDFNTSADFNENDFFRD